MSRVVAFCLSRHDVIFVVCFAQCLVTNSSPCLVTNTEACLARRYESALVAGQNFKLCPRLRLCLSSTTGSPHHVTVVLICPRCSPAMTLTVPQMPSAAPTTSPTSSPTPGERYSHSPWCISPLIVLLGTVFTHDSQKHVRGSTCSYQPRFCNEVRGVSTSSCWLFLI